MNKLAIIAILLVSTQASAAKFGASARIASNWNQIEASWVTSPTKIQFTGKNTSNTSVYCEGNVYAKTQSGELIEAYIQYSVYFGESMTEVLTTTASDPFVTAWSDIGCNP